MALLENDLVFKALSVLAMEKSLLDVDKQVYDKVIDKLNKDFNCYLPDCYEHPEYLSEILGEWYEKSHHKIVESINLQLAEFSYQEPVKRFLEIINK
jgi:hypothetical protein